MLATKARPSKRRLAMPWSRIIRFVILGLGALAMLLPFIWMLSTSFKPREEVLLFPPRFLPVEFTIANYFAVLDRLDFGQLFLNTIWVTVIKSAAMIYTSAILGYIFGKYRFRGRDTIFLLILVTMILPLEVYVIPLYQMMVGAQIADTHIALLVPYLFSAYATFLFRQFMYTIPNDLIDAARVDGAGELYIFHRIVLPLCVPVLATTAAFYVMWNWNDFLWPLIVISSGEKQMLPVALSTLVGERGLSGGGSDFGVIMAATSLTVIPVLVVFGLFQRFVVQGINLTGVK